MQGFTLSPQSIRIVRIDPDEDILQCLTDYVQQEGINQGVIMGGYGTLAAYSLHWVTHNRIPTENRFGHGEGGIEILSMNGMVIEETPHVHVSLSTDEGAFGGHLEPGCRAYVLCEIFLAEVGGPALRRVNEHVKIPDMGEGTVSRLRAAENDKS